MVVNKLYLYNVFDSSVRQSVGPVLFFLGGGGGGGELSAITLKPLHGISVNFVGNKDTFC